MAYIVAISGHKGGIGKSSLAANLAAGVAALGGRVLAVDCDMQGNFGELLGVGPETVNAGGGLSAVFIDEEPIENLIRDTPVPGLQLVPGDDPLSDVDLTLGYRLAEVEFGQREKFAWSRVLDRALAEVRGRYDLVVLDCPPGFGGVVTNAICAADAVVSPVLLEPLAMHGLQKTTDAIERMRDKMGARARLAGIVLQMLDLRSSFAQQSRAAIRDHDEFGPLVYTAEIPRTVRVIEASHFRLPVHQHDPRGTVARQYRELVDEFIARSGIAITPNAAALAAR